MIIKNKNISLLYKLLTFIIGIYGLFKISGVLDNNFDFSLFNYYTIISNLLCVIYMILSVIYLVGEKNNKTFMPEVKGALMIGILLTMFVYHFLLSGKFTMVNVNDMYITNIILHYIIPIMFVLDYVIFDKKGNFTKKSPLLWTIIPYLYFIYSIIRVKLGFGSYPYFFIDIDNLGIGKVLVNVIIISVCYIGFGYIIYFIDRKLRRK